MSGIDTAPRPEQNSCGRRLISSTSAPGRDVERLLDTGDRVHERRGKERGDLAKLGEPRHAITERQAPEGRIHQLRVHVGHVALLEQRARSTSIFAHLGAGGGAGRSPGQSRFATVEHRRWRNGTWGFMSVPIRPRHIRRGFLTTFLLAVALALVAAMTSVAGAKPQVGPTVPAAGVGTKAASNHRTAVRTASLHTRTSNAPCTRPLEKGESNGGATTMVSTRTPSRSCCS